MPVNLVATPAAELFAVPGVRWGITEAGVRKAHRKDLAVMLLDEGSAVGAVFTQNRFCAAPVQVCREHLAQGFGVRAMVINTGNANAGTGEDGLIRARSTCIALARLLELAPEQVLHIGDDAGLDVLGALACGMQTVWVNRGDHPWPHAEQPHETVSQLHELTELLR